MRFLVFSILHCIADFAALGGGCCFEEVQIIQEQCETVSKIGNVLTLAVVLGTFL